MNSITLRAEQVIEALSAEVKLELRALAEAYKRGIGQRYRWQLEAWKRETKR